MQNKQNSPTPVKLDDESKQRLKQLAASKQRTVHWLMCEAIYRYIKEEETALALKQETLKRWHEEALSEKVVSHDAMTAWLDTWGTDSEKERPSCGE